MLVMPTLSKPVLYNEPMVRMPNKTHKGIFLDIMLRKGTRYNSIKPTQSLVKNKNKKQPVLSQASLQQNMEECFKLENTSKFDLKSQCKQF